MKTSLVNLRTFQNSTCLFLINNIVVGCNGMSKFRQNGGLHNEVNKLEELEGWLAS